MGPGTAWYVPPVAAAAPHLANTNLVTQQRQCRDVTMLAARRSSNEVATRGRTRRVNSQVGGPTLVGGVVPGQYSVVRARSDVRRWQRWGAKLRVQAQGSLFHPWGLQVRARLDG